MSHAGGVSSAPENPCLRRRCGKKSQEGKLGTNSREEGGEAGGCGLLVVGGQLAVGRCQRIQMPQRKRMVRTIKQAFGFVIRRSLELQ